MSQLIHRTPGFVVKRDEVAEPLIQMFGRMLDVMQGLLFGRREVGFVVVSHRLALGPVG